MQNETESKSELELLHSLDMFAKRQKVQTQVISSLERKTNKLLAKNTVKQSKIIAKIASKSSIKSKTLEDSWQTIKNGADRIKQIQENFHIHLKEEQAKLQNIKDDFYNFYSMPSSKIKRRILFMPINLSKGQKIDLTKTNPGLKSIMVGLGWDVNVFDTGAAFDLDASAFLAGANGRCNSDKDFVFYGNLKHPSGAVEHMGDNLTGEGDGDDEQIKIDLSKIPSNIEKIAFTVTIYDAENRKQNFGQVSNAFIRIVNVENNQELIHYDLGEDFSIETAVVVGELYKHNGEWKFNAIGSGYQGGLAALCGHYGLDAE